MELLTYLLKSAGILSLFYIVYVSVLRKDTFFTANRHFLLSGIIAALVFPFVEFTKITYQEIEPLVAVESVSETLPFIQQQTEQSAFSISWWQIAAVIYCIGFVFMFVRFLKQLYTLYLLLKKYPSQKKGQYRYIKVPKSCPPFSFFNYIVYNEESHTVRELEMILKHEQVHASQRHSVDIILSNVLLIIQWINPLAWLYKKGIEENLEFIADSEAAQIVPSVKQYQLALVKVSSSRHLPPLTNNFYQSFIKKRIVMLNKNSSNKRNVWKLSVVLPLLAVFLWSFNVKEVIEYKEVSTALTDDSVSTIASESISENSSEETKVATTEAFNLPEKKTGVATTSEDISTESKALTESAKVSEEKKNLESVQKDTKEIVVKITKDTSAEELKAIQMELEAEGFKFNYSNLQYNDNNELTGITISYQSKEGNSGNYSVSSDNPINTIVIKSGANGLSMNSGGGRGNSAYINQGGGDFDQIDYEERRELMKAKREEMNERRKEIREEMNENRKEVRDDSREEIKEQREVMKEKRKAMNFERKQQIDTDVDSTRTFTRSRSQSRQGRSLTFSKNHKKITAKTTDAELEGLKNEFEAKGISFSYRGVKRNSSGEIIRIKMKLDNNKGSVTNSSYSGDDDEPIDTIYLDAEDGRTIKSRSDN